MVVPCLQIFALHAAARRQRQLVAACEEPELYSMALARVQAAAPFVAAEAPPPAIAAAVAAAGKPAAAVEAALGTHEAQHPGQQAADPALGQPTPQQQLQQAVLQQQFNPAVQAPLQQAQPQVAHSMQQQQQQQQQPPVMVMMQQQQQRTAAQGMYGHAAAFDPMSAWYATQYSGPQQQQFFGSAGPQLAMQQAALAQQQALMQQQLTACQMQQQMLCSGMQAQPGMQVPAGHHPSQQQHMSVLYGQGPLPGAGEAQPPRQSSACSTASLPQRRGDVL
jgi:hypothetical protein